MFKIDYEQLIAIVGMLIWLVFPIGMFISVLRQDRDALPSPELDLESEHLKAAQDEHLKIFEHKKMLYREDDNYEIPEKEIANVEEADADEDFIHPHSGVGSSYSHHLH